MPTHCKQELQVNKDYTMPIQQSVCLPILPPMDQDDLLQHIAAIGYTAVEI